MCLFGGSSHTKLNFFRESVLDKNDARLSTRSQQTDAIQASWPQFSGPTITEYRLQSHWAISIRFPPTRRELAHYENLFRLISFDIAASLS